MYVTCGSVWPRWKLNDEGEEIEGAAAIKTVDYSRLVALLWTTVRDLRNRVQELENIQL